MLTELNRHFSLLLILFNFVAALAYAQVVGAPDSATTLTQITEPEPEAVVTYLQRDFPKLPT